MSDPYSPLSSARPPLWNWINSLALTDPDKKATAQLDVIKTAAGLAVGGCGLFALYLAARRTIQEEPRPHPRPGQGREDPLQDRDPACLPESTHCVSYVNVGRTPAFDATNKRPRSA
ncbi:hypothetical protein N8J89_06240 [Crossiella sp. CA-258035]|uniref:hypothetical protein n=1 Tax=Crossiella sp. CA-258035 TaxID=2981138 RepID=UPI0024BD4E25|nr:hypothetical protein [Crossiella sp. CA-258035]WHT20668.1 hypothetical protein N8J89_06240 [Crossiella sp. CA-258035]